MVIDQCTPLCNKYNKKMYYKISAKILISILLSLSATIGEWGFTMLGGTKKPHFIMKYLKQEIVIFRLLQVCHFSSRKRKWFQQPPTATAQFGHICCLPVFRINHLRHYSTILASSSSTRIVTPGGIRLNINYYVRIFFMRRCVIIYEVGFPELTWRTRCQNKICLHKQCTEHIIKQGRLRIFCYLFSVTSDVFTTMPYLYLPHLVINTI